jgi:transglutaminase-like putative cysteine protease
MSSARCSRGMFLFFLALSILCLLGIIYFFADTYYLRSLRTVNNAADPRWRVFDFHSRQGAPEEIYTVADFPAVKKVKQAGKRRLLFEFHRPFQNADWKVIDTKTGKLVSEGPRAEIAFPEGPYRSVYRFETDGLPAGRAAELEIDFYPKEKYKERGLSWGDNFWLVRSTVPFTPRQPAFAAEWAGFDLRDPELEKARQIIRGKFADNLPTLERAEQVFLFVVEALQRSGGTPSDEIQAYSPFETYQSLIGEGKGFCENRALVYYLFANAAGITTRLIDLAGKFGPLKLTGHYFCESFIPETGRWIYVDPQSGIARAILGQDHPLSTLELKHLYDAGAVSGIELRVVDGETGRVVTVPAEKPMGYLVGDVVIAYPFGYGKDKSFSKIKNFIHYPTLLYSTFPVPPYFQVRQGVTGLFFVSLVLALISGLVALARRSAHNP